MGDILLAPLVLFALAMCLTPGPNVVMVTASAANFGFRRAIPQMLGITLGFALLIMAFGLGVAGLIQAEPRLHVALKYLGAAYLLYLAWRITQAGGNSPDSARTRPIGFIEAMLFQWINPKGWVTAIGALAAFTSVEGNMLLQAIAIAGLLAAACFLSVVLWAGFGAAIARFLDYPMARRSFNWAMAGLLMVSLIPVFG
jgi:threonine/homoserine/homoserine lactone efflux protein